LEDQGKPHGGKHLSQFLPAEPLKKRVPFTHADEGNSHGTRQYRKNKWSFEPDDGEPDISSQQIIGAVRHVDDPHHAEDKGESSRKQEKERAVGDAVESLRDPEFHGSVLIGKVGLLGHPSLPPVPGTCQLAHGLHTITRVSGFRVNLKRGIRNLKWNYKEG